MIDDELRKSIDAYARTLAVGYLMVEASKLARQIAMENSPERAVFFMTTIADVAAAHLAEAAI